MSAGRDNLLRVQRNMQRLQEKGAPPEDVKAYLQTEGFTPERYTRAVDLAQRAGDVRTTHGRADSLAQGLTFGWGDELASGVRSALGPGTYDEHWASRALERDHFQQQNPAGNLGLEILGTSPWLMAPPVGAAGVGAAAYRAGVPAAKAGVGYLSSALAGGAGGMVYGAGASDPGDRSRGAQIGGTLGAVTGPAVNALMKPVSGVASWARSKLPFAPAKKQLQRRADEILLGRLDKDKVDTATLKQRLDDALPPKPETIMDLAGDNTRALGDQATMFPGAAPRMARELKETRMLDAHDRVARDLENAFGLRGSVRDNVARIQTQMRQEAAPLYSQAYAIGDVSDPQVLELLKRPAMKKAYKRAVQIAGNEGIDLPPNIVDADGNLTVTSLPMRTLDLIKRGLDDVLYIGKTPTSGVGRTEQGSIEQLRQEFVRRLDDVNPAYRQARAAWAGPAAMLEAVDEGRKALRIHPEDLAGVISSLSPADRGMYKFGALDEIKTQLMNAADGRSAYGIVFGSQAKRDRLRLLVGDEAFEALQNQMRRELTIQRTNQQLLAGSQTQPRAVGMEEIQSVGMLENLSLSALVNRGMARVRTGLGSATADALAPSLYTTDRGEIANLIKRLEGVHEQQGGTQLLQGLKRGAVGGSLGANIVPSLLEQ